MKSCTMRLVVLTLAVGTAASTSNNIRGARVAPIFQNGRLGTHGVSDTHPSLVLQEFGHNPESNHVVGPMIKGAEAMIVKLAGMHGGTPIQDLVNLIKNYIGQIRDSILKQHNSDVATLSNFSSTFAGCERAKSSGESQSSSLSETQSNQSSTHIACRQRQGTAQTAFDGCSSLMNTLEGLKNSACQLVTELKKSPEAIQCPPTPSLSDANSAWRAYLEGKRNNAGTTLSNFDDLVEKCTNATNNYNDEQGSCVGGPSGAGGKKKVLDDLKADCDRDQAGLETTTCSYVSQVKSTCDDFATCAGVVVSEYERQKPTFESSEKERQEEWGAVDRLFCMLDAYAKPGGPSNTELQACSTQAHNTTHLDITWPQMVRPNPCAGLKDHPCGDAYKSTHYGSLPANAQAKNCTACTF